MSYFRGVRSILEREVRFLGVIVASGDPGFEVRGWGRTVLECIIAPPPPPMRGFPEATKQLELVYLPVVRLGIFRQKKLLLAFRVKSELAVYYS